MSAVVQLPSRIHTNFGGALTRQVPDDGIRRAALPQQSNVEGARKDIGQRLAQLLRQRLIEEEPRHLTRRAC